MKKRALAVVVLAGCGGAPRPSEPVRESIAAGHEEAELPGGVIVRGVEETVFGDLGEHVEIDTARLRVEGPGRHHLHIERGWFLDGDGYHQQWYAQTPLVLETREVVASDGEVVAVRFTPVASSLWHGAMFAIRLRIEVDGVRRDVDVPINSITPLE